MKLRLRSNQKVKDKFVVYVTNHSGNEESFYTKTRKTAERIFQDASDGGYEVKIVKLI